MVRTAGMVLFVALVVLVIYLWVVYFYSKPTCEGITNYLDGLKKQFRKKKKNKH